MTTHMVNLSDVDAQTVDHVVGTGLVGADDVQAVTTTHQRSLCYRLDLIDGTSLFVKRARRDGDGQLSTSVAHEGAVLELLHATGIPAPRVHLVSSDPDSDVQLMVTDFLVDHESWRNFRRSPGGLDAGSGRALGEVLADVHALPRPADQPPLTPTTNPYTPVLDGYVSITPTRYAAMSPAERQVAGYLQRDGIPEALGEGAAGWAPRAFVHGDVKSDNVLVRPSTTGAARPWLIDWELAGWGDPDADLGWLIGDAYTSWLASIRFGPTGTLADWLATASVPLTDVQRQVREALHAYASRPSGPAGSPTSRTRYAGLFLTHRVCAGARHTADLSARSSAMLHVAGELLRRPERHEQGWT